VTTPMRLALATAALGLAGAAAAAQAATSSQPKVTTLVGGQGSISAFAQDGRFLSWAGKDKTCNQVVRLYDVSAKKTTALTKSGTSGCKSTAKVVRIAVAASGDSARALYARYETGNNYFHWLYTGSTTKSERDAGSIIEPTDEELRVGLAGDNSFLGLGWEHANADHEADIPYSIRDGGVRKVGSDLKLTTVSGMPAVAYIAAGGGRLAIVPRGQVGAQTSPRATFYDVQLRDPATLALKSTIKTDLPISGIALSSSLVAVHVTNAIETYRSDGTRSSKQTVPSNAEDIAVGGTKVVYRVGRTIYQLGRSEPLATASATPIGLAVESSRVAWAENVDGAGRIRSLTLP
jgi:hypothetical protein